MTQDANNNNSDTIKPELASTNQPDSDLPENVREHKAFKSITEQLVQERQAKAELEARLAQLAQSDKERKEAEERAALEAKGEYQKLLEKMQAETAAKEAEYKAEILKRDITTEMLKAGCQDELVIRGALASYTDSEIPLEDYVKSLKEKSPTLFAEPQMPPASAPAQAGPSGPTNNNIDWNTIKQNLSQGSAAKAKEANALVANYLKVNGKMPPGFSN